MFKYTKRILGVGLASLMAVTAFAGCGGSTTSDGGSSSGGSSNAPADNSSSQQEVQQLTIDDIMSDADLALSKEDNVKLKVWGPQETLELLKKQCEDFVENFKKLGRTIQIECVAQGEADAQANVRTDPDNAADVFGFASDQGMELFNGNYCMPVRLQFVDAIKNANLDDAYKSVLHASEDGAEELPYAFPETGDNSYILFYNNEALTEDDVKTMEGIMKVCTDTKKKFAFNVGNGFYGAVIPFTAGGTLGLNPDDNTLQQLNYNEEDVTKVAKAFADLCANEYFKDEDVNQTLVSGFKNGTHIAGVGGSWMIKNMEKALGDKLGAAKLPTINVDGEDKPLVPLYGYKNIGVNAKTKYPYTSQALAFYLTSEACQKERCEECGWGPSIKSLAESDLVTSNVCLNALYESQKNSVPQVNICSSFWDATGAYGAYMVNKDKKHDDASLKSQYEEMVKNITKG